MERLAWTSMLFPGCRPAVFDDIPVTAIVTMGAVGTGTRYLFTALHRDEADFENNKASGWQQGTEIAVDQFVDHVRAMNWLCSTSGRGARARTRRPARRSARSGGEQPLAGGAAAGVELLLQEVGEDHTSRRRDPRREPSAGATA
jgi:hypothetical protein